MRQCPDPADKINCGLAAAQNLVDNNHVLLDYSERATGRGSGLYVDRRGSSAFEVLTQIEVRAEDLLDIADFGCVACGGCVQIIDAFGTMTVRKDST